VVQQMRYGRSNNLPAYALKYTQLLV